MAPEGRQRLGLEAWSDPPKLGRNCRASQGWKSKERGAGCMRRAGVEVGWGSKVCWWQPQGGGDVCVVGVKVGLRAENKRIFLGYIVT